jgi:hypothetical protein
VTEDWAIDTWVLYEAENENFSSAQFLMSILTKRDFVLLDFEGNIRDEYYRCIARVKKAKRGRTFLVAKWVGIIVSKYAQFYSGKLSKKIQTDLANLQFDVSDWPFVSVASKSKSRRLVSGDSDYSPEVRAYLAKRLKVRVLSTDEGIEEMK